MTEPEDRYAMAQIDGDAELARLRMLEAINDPATERRLDALEVAEGWRCLEVGAGGGSVTRSLAARVGARGHVVAADRDPRFLQNLDLAQVEVIRHDITKGPVEPRGFDLVHCRAVLAHVTDFDGAAENLVASARSGGWVFVEEPDYGGCMEPCDPSHPGTEIFLHYLEGLRDGRRMDVDAGRHAYRSLRAAGLTDLTCEGISAIVEGGSFRARYRKFTMENVRDMAVGSGNYTTESFQRLLDLFEDPSFSYIDNLWLGVTGRVA
ncbi:methyltransferase domain-containing protein [Myxococcota bacterium]|nr:methyltransferase domain-containing protein [Myxococcota bacterium]